MTCSRCEDLFAAHFDGLLDDNDERQLGAHLAECEPCRMSLDETRRLVQQLENDQPCVVVPSITPAVMDRIVHRQAIGLKQYDMIKRVAKISAAAALLIGLAIVVPYAMPRPLSGRLYASELSAARKQMEDVKTATWKISYYERFIGPGGAGSRWFRVKNMDQRYVFKSPGRYRCENLDEDGKVSYVTIEDKASRAKLDINHRTRTATLASLAESMYHPRGPFGNYLDLMTREDLRPLGTEDVAGRPASGFRFESRNGLLGQYRSVDFWLDTATKRLVQCKQPGGDLVSAADLVHERAWAIPSGESIEDEGKVFQRARGGAVNQCHVVSAIAFDVAVDDSAFSFEPPAGYAVKAVKPPLITEKDVLEFMRIVADSYGQTFPDRMPHFAHNSQEDLDRLERAQQAVREKNSPSPAQVKLVEAMDRWWRTGIPGPGPMHVFITQQIVEGSWKYLGKGAKLGDKERIVCWYRPKGSPTYHVVHGDLSVKEVEPENLPLPIGR